MDFVLFIILFNYVKNVNNLLEDFILESMKNFRYEIMLLILF